MIIIFQKTHYRAAISENFPDIQHQYGFTSLLHKKNKKMFHSIYKKDPLSILAFFIVMSLVSCGKNETDTIAIIKGSDYFPLDIGKTATFNVDTVIYDQQPSGGTVIDTFKWQVKDAIVDTFRDKNNILRYRIERSEKRIGTPVFQVNHVFSTAFTTDYALMFESNFTYIKFPALLKQGISWDGNIFNDETTELDIAGDVLKPFSNTWNFEVLTVGKAEKIGGKDYADVLTIEAQTDPRVLTERRYSLEKYAKGIGLVYKEVKVLDTQKLDATIAWEKRAQKGYILKQIRVD